MQSQLMSGDVGSSPHTRGTLPKACTRVHCSGDHPRIRGEHCSAAFLAAKAHGIIPAYAGNTNGGTAVFRMAPGSSPHTRGTRCTHWCCSGRSRDHPRIRGEHAVDVGHVGVGAGIIPAYAGNTKSMRPPPNTFSGSSPHTRGTRRRPAR